MSGQVKAVRPQYNGFIQEVYRMRRVVSSILAVVCLLFSNAVGQVLTGTISGVVTDSTEAVVPNAAVTINNADTRVTVWRGMTNESGLYRALNGLIQREIVYRILRGPEGARLRAIANAGRSDPTDGEGDRVDQGELREAATGGRSRKDRGHGRLHSAPPFSDADRHESCSVSEASSVAGSPGT